MSLKITHFTDTHFRLRSPRARKSGYFDQLKEKVQYIFDEESDSDFFVITGDIGDTSTWSERLYKEVSQLFLNCPSEIIYISGNHDIQNKLSENDFWVKNLRLLENVRYLSDDKPFSVTVGDDNGLITFHARNFKRDRDGTIEQFIVDKPEPDEKKTFDIGLFHTYVLEDSTPFIDHVMISDVLEKTNLDLILNGHYHDSLVKQDKNTLYFNPGSLSRGVCNETNIGRIPKYGSFEISYDDGFDIDHQLKEIGVAKPWGEIVHDFYKTNKEQSLESEKIEKSVSSLKKASEENNSSALKQNLKTVLRDQDRDDLIDLGVYLLEKAESDLQQ